MPIVRTWRCADCSAVYDLLHFADGDAWAQSREDGRDHDTSCPTCGSTERTWQLSAGTAIETGGEHGVGRRYPYFDRAFNCEVRSKQHRAQLCRQHNVVPLDGADITQSIRAQHSADEAESERLDVEQRKLEHSPEMRDYRRAEDRGWVADQMKVAREQHDRTRRAHRAKQAKRLERQLATEKNPVKRRILERAAKRGF